MCVHEEKKNDVKESNVIARSFKYSYPLNLAVSSDKRFLFSLFIAEL